MKERPILFSGPMVRAVMRELNPKTQTRRIMDNQPTETPVVATFQVGKGKRYRSDLPHKVVATFGEQCCVCPYGVPGDRLWVREAWATPHDCDHLKPREIPPGTRVHYIASWQGPCGLLQRPSMFMPRWASRLTLEVVNVRVERLQQISEEDAIAEGMTRPVGTSFADLWDEINGKGAWDANPFVWVVEFKRVSA